MLSAKFKNLIKTGELVKAPVPVDDNFIDQTYWLYTRKASKGHRKRDLEKTIELADELQAWAYHRENTHRVCSGEPGWNWIRSEEKYNKWEKLEYVPIGIAFPASQILDDLIEKAMVKENRVMEREIAIRNSIPLTLEMPDSLNQNGSLPEDRMVGYFRADHDGYRWHYTWFNGKNNEANVGETKKELEHVGTQLVFHGFLNGVSSMREFVYETGATAVSTENDEYNFYYSGFCCDYWVRFILRRGDYNMYIKCYQKESLFHAKPEEIREVVLGEKIEKLTCRYGMPCEVQ